MNPSEKQRLALTFDRDPHPDEEELQHDLPACAMLGDDLWRGSDELTPLEVLERNHAEGLTGPERAKGKNTVLADVFKLRFHRKTA